MIKDATCGLKTNKKGTQVIYIEQRLLNKLDKERTIERGRDRCRKADKEREK